MINELKDLVRKLKKENQERSITMNNGNLSDYNHTVKVHTIIHWILSRELKLL